MTTAALLAVAVCPPLAVLGILALVLPPRPSESAASPEPAAPGPAAPGPCFAYFDLDAARQVARIPVPAVRGHDGAVLDATAVAGCAPTVRIGGIR